MKFGITPPKEVIIRKILLDILFLRVAENIPIRFPKK